MRRLIVLLLLSLCSLSLQAPIKKSQAPKEVDETYKRVHELMKLEFGSDSPPISQFSASVHNVPMRDGVTLRTRVWIPRGYVEGEKRSAVLDRTPYGPAYTAMSLIWSFDGYVIVMQDQRGTFLSGGEYEIYRRDAEDAYDTMEWISKQSWSNSKVFPFGVSADAISVYSQVMIDTPWIAAHVSIFGTGNGHALCYPGGVYNQMLVERWLESPCEECVQDVIDNEQDGDFWDSINITDHYANVKYPSVHWAGWYDIFLQHQINAFNGYYTKGDNSVKDSTYLLVEPHGHCYDVVFLKGISLLGLRLARKIFELADTGVRDPLLDEIKAINFFVMGPKDDGPFSPGNYFVSLDEWPQTTPTQYFLTSSGGLTNKAQIGSTNITYSYDPSSPTPTIGGNNLYGTCGAYDQTSNELRKDVITFTSDALVRDLAITGAIKAILYVSTTANDTDFLVKLTDVYPDGRSILIQEGSFRMKWREDKRSKPQLVEPNKIYEIEVEIWSASLIFARGHQIRISVSSSNEPRFHLNPNNGLLVGEGGGSVVAENTIHMGDSTPSHLILPVVDLEDIPAAKYNFDKTLFPMA